jgi:hypothetical protein
MEKKQSKTRLSHKCPPHGHPFCFPRETHKTKNVNEKLLLLLLAKRGTLSFL